MPLPLRKRRKLRQIKRRKIRSARTRRLTFETLEERTVLSTFAVTTLGDSGAGTLREAILLANTNPGADTITFDVAGTISVASQLPAINDGTGGTFVDGTSAPGFAGSPVVILQGPGSTSFTGLQINSPNNEIRGLQIDSFNRGIEISGVSASGNILTGNYIGTDGTTLKPNNTGVRIEGASFNRVGTNADGVNDLEERNIISGNSSQGVLILGSGATGNTLAGNYIGTTATGAAPLPNLRGIVVGARNNLIGGTAVGAGNLISGNVFEGINLVTSGATENVIQGNFIGTDASGFGSVPNQTGIYVNSAPNNFVGGPAIGARNIISGNALDGILIQGTGSTANLVQGNYIGTTVTGDAALSNGSFGVWVKNAPSNIIGGTSGDARNVISGNVSGGVVISEAGATGNLVQGNFVGTNASGTTALGNGSGIGITKGAPYTTIGGSAQGSRNVISGNLGNGISVSGPGTIIAGNFIGTDYSGTVSVGNGRDGIILFSSNNRVGTDGDGIDDYNEQNTISGNSHNGISISSSSNNVIAGNALGTDSGGILDLGNDDAGIYVSGNSNGNLLGGIVSSTSNIVAFNRGRGVFVQSGTGNAVQRNAIYSNGNLGIDLGPFGITANDTGDGDTGANNLQNFPVLTSAVSAGGSTTIQGTLNSTPNTVVTVEFFSNAVADPSGFGEGEQFIGSTSVTTDGSGNISFSATFATTTTPGAFISATATDPNGNTSEFSQSNVQVPLPNQSPQANDDGYNLSEDNTLTVAAPGVLDNDTDDDGDNLSAILVSGPSNGTVTLNADGSFSYTPDPNFNGTDSFTYKANDGQADSNVATVTITVNSVNDPPVANDDAYSVDEDNTLNAASVLGNDDDAHGGAPSENNTPLMAQLVSGPSNGSLSLNSNGTFTYTPDANFNGSDSFTYQAVDSLGGVSNTATVTITVNSVNDAPVAADDAYSVDEDNTLNGSSVLANDDDSHSGAPSENNTPLSAQLVSGPGDGSLTLDSDGTFTYTPDLNFNGSDSFTYQAVDSLGGVSNTAMVTITVNSVNDAPVAADDSYSVDEDNTLSGSSVLANDDDSHGGAPGENNTPLSAQLVSGPSNGSLTLNSNGTFTYTPDANFNGSDSFTYQAVDSLGGASNTATVTITVNSVNDVPVAADDAYSVDEDNTLNGSSVLANDDDSHSGAPSENNPPLSAQLVSGPGNGSLTLNSNGTFTYTPDANFNGGDSFTYQAVDSLGGVSNTATVTITVNSLNDAPVAVADAYSVEEDNTLSGSSVLANDDDSHSGAPSENNTPLSAQLVSGPGNGSLTLNSDGTFSYTPDADFNGSDSFTYQAVDSLGGVSNTATVTITVSDVNDAPQARNDSVATDEDTPLSANVLTNDTDPDNTNGIAGNEDTLSVSAVNGSAANVGSATATANGIVTVQSDGNFSYTPNANFFGTDTFTYEVSDGRGGTDTATATITVTEVNDAPVASDDSAATAEDTPTSGNVLTNDTDPDNTDGIAGNENTLSVSSVNGSASNVGAATATANGTVTVEADGNFSYTPNANFFGTDTFTYEVSDGRGGTDTATVTITVTEVNDAPVANDDSAATAEDTPTSGNVLTNDTDPDNTDGIAGNEDTLTISAVNGSAANVGTATATANGTVTVQADGSFSYTPNANFFGTDTFSYEVSDGRGGSDTATVTVTVTEVNDAPVAGDDNYTTDEDIALVVPVPGVLGNDNDVEGDSLIAGLVSGPSNGTLVLNADGSFTYTPDAGFFGTDSFTYTANDGQDDSNIATVSITVNPGTGVTLQPDPCDATKTALFVRGTDENDHIVVRRVGNTEAVEVIFNGVTHGPYTPTGRILVFGKDGNDDIQVANSVSHATWLYGGTGDDRLRGGDGHDVLLGEEGDDLLVGGGGRDLLIGGAGADRVVGNSDDDIIVAGYTDFDAHDAALCAIMDEWTSGHDFETRVNNLRDGSGSADRVNGAYFLNDSTVHDDGVKDVLTGSSGQDWFLFNEDGDGDPTNKDKVTDMSTFEQLFAEDIDFIYGP